MLETIKNFSKTIKEEIQNKKIHLVSHYDTDGITSAAIFSKTLERLNKQFSVKIIKQLNEEEISSFPKDKIIIMIDLGSGSLGALSKIKNTILIIDHHEISSEKIPENVKILNPHLLKEYENLCSAELTYLISKQISEENKDLAYLAIIGMVGDTMEKSINKTRNLIIKEADVRIRRGLLIYPSTRPIDKALEFSSRPFIPGVTGNPKGVFELLKEAEIEKKDTIYKTLIDLNEDEMKRLSTSIMLRLPANKNSEYIGDLYLIRFFNKVEDARELSAIINACSRMDNPEISLMLCLGNSIARKKAERIYFKYRQHIISGLRYIEENRKIVGKEYVIINARDQIKDTLIGTLASILSFSAVYEEGTVIVAMVYDKDKIKVSTRIAGRNPKSSRNLKELMDSVVDSIGGESGGHKDAAGCIIDKNQENKFIELIQRQLAIEMVKM